MEDRDGGYYGLDNDVFCIVSLAMVHRCFLLRFHSLPNFTAPPTLKGTPPTVNENVMWTACFTLPKFAALYAISVILP